MLSKSVCSIPSRFSISWWNKSTAFKVDLDSESVLDLDSLRLSGLRSDCLDCFFLNGGCLYPATDSCYLFEVGHVIG